MSKTRLADEYADIAARLAQLEREKIEAINTPMAEMPKAWPMYAHSDSQAPDDNAAWGYVCWHGDGSYHMPSWTQVPSMYCAPDDDCA